VVEESLLPEYHTTALDKSLQTFRRIVIISYTRIYLFEFSRTSTPSFIIVDGLDVREQSEI